jgi:hypothetical protein
LRFVSASRFLFMALQRHSTGNSEAARYTQLPVRSSNGE